MQVNQQFVNIKTNFNLNHLIFYIFLLVHFSQLNSYILFNQNNKKYLINYILTIINLKNYS